MSAHPELSEKEKKSVMNSCAVNDLAVCAIDMAEIKKEVDIEYHHINPLTDSNKIDPANFSVVCRKHHKEMGELSITEFKALAEIGDFFSGSSIKKLNDVINLKLGKENSLKKLKIARDNSNLKIEFDSDVYSKNFSIDLLTCPSTGFKYFYMPVPIEYIHNDEELQPRPLETDRLWSLYRHLLVNSQLTPSVCRLSGNNILLFDGQHKASAQIWAGRKEIECKIYVDADIKSLKETNLMAHDKLRQMPFFTSVLINKWASIFSEEWKEYLSVKGAKSEAGFVRFLVHKGKKRSEALNMMESNIYDSIIEDKENAVIKYVAEYSKKKKSFLTVTRLRQTIFKKFIAPPPLDLDIEESDRLREIERKNIIRFLNLITYYSLEENEDGASTHSEIIYLNGAFKAWVGIMRDVIATILEIYDENEKTEIFLQPISEDNWQEIEKCLSLLFERRVWKDDSEDNISTLRLSSESQVRKYLSRRGVSVNEILSGTGIIEDSNNFVD